MSPFLPEEINGIADLASEYCVMVPESVTTYIDKLATLINQISITDKNRTLCEFSNISSKELCSAFMSLEIDADESVNVIWVPDRKGICINSYDLFVNHFENLYYAGCDDIWVTNDSISWVIEINHEEQFWYYSSRNE